ncbi:MAG: LamG domain-containing protein, partial [Bacteroidetes bacterium]|nr:LamG domain-containing protein [Bacteroidota bacterium]
MKSKANQAKTKATNKVIKHLLFTDGLSFGGRICLLFISILALGLPALNCFAQQELYSTPFFSDANLVAYWRLEGNSQDAKGSNNGSDVDMSYDNSYGKFGKGAYFNGSSSKISISNDFVSGGKIFSISAWINPTSGGGNYNIVGKQGSASNSFQFA